MPRRIYLAGPVDNVDDPGGWRTGLRDRYPGIEWVDPFERFPEYRDDPGEVVEWCLRQAKRCDVLVGRLHTGVTVGTHHEIQRALAAGRTVVVEAPDPAALSNFVVERPCSDEPGELVLAGSLDECVRRLRPEAQEVSV